MFTTAMILLRSSLLLTLHLTGSINSFPKPLTAEEEREYLRRYAEGDIEARNVLIERNLRLVAHIIKKYYTQTADQEDLISIGTIGLIKGISSYDPEKGARLATYAARCIENEILMHFRAQKKLQGEVSLSDTLETDKDGNSLFLLDVVGVEDTMLEDIEAKDACLRLRKLVRECLTEREADIIERRYGICGRSPKTQRELAADYNISRSYVSRRAYCKQIPGKPNGLSGYLGGCRKSRQSITGGKKDSVKGTQEGFLSRAISPPRRQIWAKGPNLPQLVEKPKGFSTS